MRRQSKHAKELFFSLPTPTQTLSLHCYCVLHGESSGRTTGHFLHCCCRALASSISLKLLRTGTNKRRKLVRARSSRSFYCNSSKNDTWRQNKKPQIHYPGTTFSNFSDELRHLLRAQKRLSVFHTHGSAPRTLYICLAKYWIEGKINNFFFVS